MPVFETLGKINRYVKSSLECSWGCNDCNPSTGLVWSVSTPIAPAVLKPRHKGLGGSQPPLIFAVLRICCDYLNLKLFHSCAFKECAYLLTKTLYLDTESFSKFQQAGGCCSPQLPLSKILGFVGLGPSSSCFLSDVTVSDILLFLATTYKSENVKGLVYT